MENNISINEKFKENRIIYLKGILDTVDVMNIIKDLHELDEENDEIKLYITCSFKNFTDALMLYDILKNLKSSVATYTLGSIRDSTLFVVLAGEKRIGMEHTKCYLHTYEPVVFNNLHNLKGFIAYRDKLLKNFINIVNENTTKNIPKLFKENIFLDNKKMLEYNILTEVKVG